MSKMNVGVQGYENINLRIFKDSETGEFYIEVELRGKIKSYAKTKGKVYLSKDSVIYNLEIVAGAIAEHQNETFKEMHDPDKCAEAARRAYFELREQLNKQNIDILPGVENIG